jgi:protein-L-isoaspartate(D-aspartate) O-methyltransferase
VDQLNDDFASQQPADVFVEERRWMVEHQLRSRGIADRRVLQAMLEVPREKFVPANLVPLAHQDAAQPIGHEQTISQPFTVAYMVEAAQLTGGEKVLEIGTGSGYGAAVLSRVSRQVYTVERIEELAEVAKARLARLGYDNVTVVLGDGSRGLAEHQPYDAIIVTAAARELPAAYQEQLADGGRIVIPLGNQYYGQTMYRYTRHGDRWDIDNLGGFAFVPLISAQDQPDD